MTWQILFMACFPNGKWHIVHKANGWALCGRGAPDHEWTWGQEVHPDDTICTNICKTCEAILKR